MENKKTLYIVITILALALLALGGYVVYDKIYSDKPQTEKKDNENKTLKYSYDLSKRTVIQSVSKGYIEVVVDKDGNAYLTIVGNLNYEEDEDLKRNLETIQKKFEKLSPRDYADEGGNTSFDGFKLNVEKVLTAYHIYIGNGGSSYFIFIKENGSISYLSYSDIITKGEINLKDISNVKDIVTIVENNHSMMPYAIDINGKEINLFDYIK